MSSDGVQGLAAETQDDPIERMLARYAPPQDEFDVVLPEGEVLRFRAFRSYAEQKQFEREAVRWYQSLPMPKTEEAKAHPYGDLIPDDAQSAIAAYTIAELSIKPKFGHPQALRMLRAAGMVGYILKSIDLENRAIGALFEQKLLEQAKNGFGATATSEPS